MKRYIRIYLLLLRLNLSVLMAYRVSFVNSIVGTIGWGIISILSMYLLTINISNAYGWSKTDLLIAAGVYSVIIGIFHVLFSRNFERFSRIIHLGQLDSILVKPVDSQFLISMWLFNYASLLRVFVGGLFIFYILHVMHIVISFLNVLGFLALMTSSLFLLYAVWFTFTTFTVWFTNLSNLVDFLYGFSYLGRYPPEMVRQSRNVFLFIFLPLTLIATVPAKTIIQKASVVDITELLFFSFFLFFLSRKFWQFALRFYTSASG